MPKFTATLNSWNSDSFNQTLKDEIQNLKSGVLPLHLATTQGGMVDDSNISASIIHSSENDDCIQTKVGIFFNEVVGGCNCHDDPVSENAYCEIILSINKETAETDFTVLSD
ncbi:MAG: glucosamine--fructose-6-phosphate aminotransferase [Gammaproteobacteria bacterium]|nr:glucosamine--fructose-6-phosphate aminotransferase [Gammaproteobacteria bacterium]